LICCFFIFAFAQEKDSKNNDKKNESTPVEVKVNVLVKDVSGNLVNDMKAENLKIFEDGVEQKITYFAKKEPVLNVGLIMDNTGSMRLLLDDSIKAGVSFTNYLTEKDEAFLIRFVSSDKIQLVQDWTPSGNLLQRGLNELYVEGGQSAVIDALYISTQKILEREKQQKSTRYALVLIGDGDDRDSFYKAAQLYELLKGTDIQIFPIIFPVEYYKKDEKAAKKFMNEVALKTGGTAYFLSSASKKKPDFKDSITSAVKALADELRSQYIVGYTSTNPKRDDTARRLTVEVADNEKGEKRQGFIRESFVVPKEK
jgi:Ca-activated chloride channel homolog